MTNQINSMRMNGRGLPTRKHAIFKHDFEFEITSEIHVLSTIFLLLKSPNYATKI